MKSGNLNFLEPSGPLQVCNGTALPLPYVTDKTNKYYINKRKYGVQHSTLEPYHTVGSHEPSSGTYIENSLKI